MLPICCTYCTYSHTLGVRCMHSDDNADARFREYLLDQAKEQIKFSAQDRRLKVHDGTSLFPFSIFIFCLAVRC